MKQRKLLVLFIVLLVSFLTLQLSFADERSCLIAYERMTIEIENSASANRAGDVCRAADCLERALNWLGTCENECTYSRKE